MCVLVCALGGASPTREQLLNGCDNNPDGFGYAVLFESGEIARGTGLLASAVIDEYLSSVFRGSVVASMFHARITTSGGSTLANCHPFTIPASTGFESVLGHNGILPLAVPAGSSRNDTRIFTEDLFSSMGGVRSLESASVWDFWEKWLGSNKVAILTNDPHAFYPLMIMNEALGEWVGDVWFSNNSCEYSWDSYSSGSKWSSRSGWDSFEDEDTCGICKGVDIDTLGVCLFCGCCVICENYSCDCVLLEDYDEDTDTLEDMHTLEDEVSALGQRLGWDCF